MTRVNHVEHVLLLLREQLQRASKGREPGRKETQRVTGRTPPPLDRVRALAALDSLPEEDMNRAVIRGLLAEEFGEAIGNDPAFAAITDEVACAIEALPGGPALMAQAIAQLKGQT